MKKDQLFFFRDLEHNSNLENGKSHAPGGIAKIFEPEPVPSGKDIIVTYYDPFLDVISHSWRSYDEVELFPAEDFELEGHRLLERSKQKNSRSTLI